jgi:hypothetical protein
MSASNMLEDGTLAKGVVEQSDEVAELFRANQADAAAGNLASHESIGDGNYYADPVQSKDGPLEKQLTYVCLFSRWQIHTVVHLSGH